MQLIFQNTSKVGILCCFSNTRGVFMKHIKRNILSAIVLSGALVSGAYAATSPIHFGAQPAAVNDVHIVNHTLDSYSVNIYGEPSGASYGNAELGINYPYNSMWIDFMYGDNAVCVTIMRDADGKIDFSGCGLTRGSTIDVPVSAAFKAQHPKK